MTVERESAMIEGTLLEKIVEMIVERIEEISLEMIDERLEGNTRLTIDGISRVMTEGIFLVMIGGSILIAIAIIDQMIVRIHVNPVHTIARILETIDFMIALALDLVLLRDVANCIFFFNFPGPLTMTHCVF